MKRNYYIIADLFDYEIDETGTPRINMREN